MRVPELELLWWDGCPSTDRAVAELREALAELGLERAELKMREIQSDAEARAEAFAGSPTISKKRWTAQRVRTAHGKTTRRVDGPLSIPGELSAFMPK